MKRSSVSALPLRTVAILLASAIPAVPAARAQQAEQPQPPAQGPIGPPQLRDFQLTPRERIVTQPRPAPSPPQQQATPAPDPAARAPAAQRQPGAAPAAVTAPVQRAPIRTETPATVQPGTDAPAPVADVPAPDAPLPAASAPPPADVPVGAVPVPVQDGITPPAEPASDGGVPLWLLLLGGVGLGVAGYLVVTRRRGRRVLALSTPATAAVQAPPRAPRADPVPRAWLEVELRPERTTADPAESAVEFEMTIRNSGGSAAKNIKLQAKLVCSTPEQDKEIAEFQRKKPGEHRTLTIPDLPAGEELKLKGRVDVKQEEMKAMQVDQRLLFVPLVAVNAFYDWGTARTGQTSRSFLVGRERADNPAKMAPFRLDLGPRVYRTLGQRPYRVERRV